MATSTLLLDTHLKALRLPTFLREYDKVARHCAQEGLDCPRYLFLRRPSFLGHGLRDNPMS